MTPFVVRASARATRRAITLVEVLVTLGIITMLMGLLFVGLRGATEIGRATACLNNMRNIGAAVLTYANVHDGELPISSHTTGSLTAPSAWLQTLAPLGAAGSVLWCPSDPFCEQRLTSYAMNDYLEPLTPGIDFDPISGATLPGGRTNAITKLHVVPSPTATILFVETRGTGVLDHIHAVGWTSADQIGAWVATTRHQDGANYLFVDGHAAAVPWNRLKSGFTVETSVFNPETAN
jgi:prepilin-type processing-associated H-X9-DG protein